MDAAVNTSPIAPKKPKRNYETYYKTYYETHKEAINKRRSTGKPRGRPKKTEAGLPLRVVEGYDSSTSSTSNISV